MPVNILYDDLIQQIRNNPVVTIGEEDMLLEYVNQTSGTPNQHGDIPIEITGIDDFKRFKSIDPIPTLLVFSRTMRYRQYQDVLDSIPAPPVDPIQEPEQIDGADQDVGGKDDTNSQSEEDNANISSSSISSSGSTTETDANDGDGEKVEPETDRENKDEDGGSDENPEESSSDLGASSSTLSSEAGTEEPDPTIRAPDVSYPYLIVHAQARPGPYQPELDAHIHTRGGVDADEWIQYSMLPGMTGGNKKKKKRVKRRTKSRKKHRHRSKSKSFKKRKSVY